MPPSEPTHGAGPAPRQGAGGGWGCAKSVTEASAIASAVVKTDLRVMVRPFLNSATDDCIGFRARLNLSMRFSAEPCSAEERPPRSESGAVRAFPGGRDRAGSG